MAANAKPQMKPIHIPTAPRCNGNAHNKPTDNPTTIYATKAIIIGTFTSVIPRNMAAPTA